MKILDKERIEIDFVSLIFQLIFRPRRELHFFSQYEILSYSADKKNMKKMNG